MKILLITDQHFGVRNDNVHFINHYRKFYSQIVIPFIKASKIDTVINLGDTFDKRRSINYLSLNEAKQMWFDPLAELGVQMHMLVGNHDIYYKNTLRVNAPKEILSSYDNIISYDSPCTVNFDGLDICFIPWICDDNYDKTLLTITQTEATIAMGHLELNGFEAHPGHYMENGMQQTKIQYITKQSTTKKASQKFFKMQLLEKLRSGTGSLFSLQLITMTIHKLIFHIWINLTEYM